MGPNTTEFRNYLNNHLSSMSWQDSSKYKKHFYISLSFLISLIVLSIIVLILTMVAWDNPGIAIGINLVTLVMTLIALMFTVVSFSQWRSRRKTNKNHLLNLIPKDIYKSYYEMVYPNNVLKFVGLFDSQKFLGTKGFVFEIKGERIWWEISERTETRTYTYGKTTSSYTVYIMENMLRLMAHKVDNYQPIVLIAKPSKGKDKQQPDQFISPSISFNKKFKVFGNDQFQMTKLFDPSVIDYFDNSENYQKYLTHPIHIDNGFAYTSFQSSESRTSWLPWIDRFDRLSITKEHYVDEIIYRIGRDFNLFFEAYDLFRPFDFQKVYLQK